MDSDERDPDRPPAARTTGPADGRPRPDPDLPPPAGPVTPTPQVDPSDESGRQTATTAHSVSRLEEAN